MPRPIVKIMDHDRAYYLEWTTIADAPRTYGMSLEELKAYYRQEYGRDGEAALPAMLARVEAHGTSYVRPTTAAELIRHNRAGPNETELSMEELILHYCRNHPTV